MDSWVTGIVESMGALGVALLMALENIFPPIPSELVMPLAGYTASEGDLDIWLAIALGSVGSLVGTLPWYFLARWANRDKFHDWVDKHGHWLTLDNGELERVEKFFGKHGRWVVVVGRLIPGVRTLISVPAGFCKMPLVKYLAYSMIGTVIWTGALGLVGKVLGDKYDSISTYLGPITYGVIGVMLLVYLVRLVKMRHRNHAQRRESHA